MKLKKTKEQDLKKFQMGINEILQQVNTELEK